MQPHVRTVAAINARKQKLLALLRHQSTQEKRTYSVSGTAARLRQDGTARAQLWWQLLQSRRAQRLEVVLLALLLRVMPACRWNRTYWQQFWQGCEHRSRGWSYPTWLDPEDLLGK